MDSPAASLDAATATPERRAPRRGWRSPARWFAVIAAVLGAIVLATLAASPLLSRKAKSHVIETLERRFNSDVEIRDLRVAVLPWPSASGGGLALRKRGRTDGPPLIAVREFSVSAGPFGLFTSPVRVGHVRVHGLEITLTKDDDEKDERAEAERQDTDRSNGGGDGDVRVHVERIDVDEARLVLVPDKPGKEPKVFEIHELVMLRVGRDRPLGFDARLTNPLPKGEIQTEGEFGPWDAEKPRRTHVWGKYTFENADLGTIDGLAGILSSKGEFSGPLERLDVKGTTTTPDFGLTISDQRLPLETTFEAVVDGTNGDTILNLVSAKLQDTPIETRGRVVDAPGSGREVALEASITGGRIEDLLRLSVKGSRPFLTGRVDMKTSLLLPAGKGPVPRRLNLDGRFSLSRARFTSTEVRQKLGEMDARAGGRAKDLDDDSPATGDVVSDMAARFRLRGGSLTLTPLTFRMPSATVRVNGAYGLESEQLDFTGSVRMDAKVSQTVTGFKSWLLKLADPLFNKKGGGSEVPITIKGTREEPDFGLDVKRALRLKR